MTTYLRLDMCNENPGSAHDINSVWLLQLLHVRINNLKQTPIESAKHRY